MIAASEPAGPRKRSLGIRVYLSGFTIPIGLFRGSTELTSLLLCFCRILLDNRGRRLGVRLESCQCSGLRSASDLSLAPPRPSSLTFSSVATPKYLKSQHTCLYHQDDEEEASTDRPGPLPRTEAEGGAREGREASPWFHQSWKYVFHEFNPSGCEYNSLAVT